MTDTAADTPADQASDQVILHHVIVVGGTTDEWAAMSDESWADLLQRLGGAAGAVGARWLVLRPYAGDTAGLPAGASRARQLHVGGCEVLADAETDGRRRLVGAVRELHERGVRITEQALDDVLHSPGEVDPDLVVVLGPPSRLPLALVWELAYSELVFLDLAWRDFDEVQLAAAIDSYTTRRRRFGGVDE